MVESQARAAALDAPCAPPSEASALPPAQGPSYLHSSHITKLGVGCIEEERYPSLVTGKGGAPLLPPLKRAGPETDESSISQIRASAGPKGSGGPAVYRHHHRGLHRSVVGASYKFANGPSQQNGHVTPSLYSERSSSESNYHAPGFFYPQMPGHAAYFGVNVAEVLAELERERRKNAELQGRLNSLEAKLGGGNKQGASVQNGNNKKSRKQRRVEKISVDGEDGDSRKVAVPNDHENQFPAAIKQEEEVIVNVALRQESSQPPAGRHDSGVTWMSREEVTAADLEKLNKDIVSERDDSGDTDDDDDDEEEDECQEEEDGEGKEEGREKKKRKTEGEESRRGGVSNVKGEAEKLFFSAPGDIEQEEDESDDEEKRMRRRKKRKEGKKAKRGESMLFTKRGFGNELGSFRGSGIMSSYKKAPKTAFCPKEVKRVMESGVLALKNAQSHTMRKIIVFASLGIRHGCEDLYELDFSHFSVVQRGEPYKSPKDPGEHVLYDNPGVRTKIFYPNRQNPVLCPVRILDEEKAMRPVGPTCPSCLFLCIKYGGRTRNLPQNEYVRQRMGRNKLKSFGPLMCQMALLVHIRTGSFFFKALGITLLFMAGFPDDLVRKETKYRNLDLLQKYYRSDEDAKGEQLFHPYPPFFPHAMIMGPAVPQKAAVVAKVVGKKGPPPLLSKPPSTPVVPRYLQPLSARPVTTSSFRGLPPAFAPPLPSLPAVLPTAAAGSQNPSLPAPPCPPPFGMYPPYPPGGFAPMPWTLNSYPPPGPYPASPFVYPPFSHSPQFMPPFYGPAYHFAPYSNQMKVKKESKKAVPESEESGSDSDSGSSGAGQKNDEKRESLDNKEA